MRPLTNELPKPLVKINGRPLLDYTIAHLMNAGISKVVLNTHYHHEKLQNWALEKVASTPPLSLTLHHEETLLDTGGGLKNVIEKDKYRSPFFMINGDAFWENSAEGQTLAQMAAEWIEGRSPLQLLLQDKNSMQLTQGSGDYWLDENGKPHRAKDKDGDYMFAGLRITRPDILEYAPQDKEIFSFLACMDGAEEAGTLSAHIHKGAWHHISTPEDVQTLNTHLQNAANIEAERCAV
jgi:MurNAc alpha-1-phosphate uridylyltransferase